MVDLNRLFQEWETEQEVSDDLFPDRDANFIANLLKDVKDFGGGLATVASYAPAVLTGKANVDVGQLLNGLKMGMLEQYGQQRGFNPKALAQSFYAHPLNIVDILPVAKGLGITGKAGKALGTAFPKTARAMNAVRNSFRGGSYIDDAINITGRNKVLQSLDDAAQAGVKAADMSGVSKIDDIVRGSGSNQIRKFLKNKNTFFSNVPHQVGQPTVAPLAGLEKPLSALDNTFKKAVLASPAWLVGNRAGNMTFNALAGVGADDYMRAAKGYKGLVPDKGLGGFYQASKTGSSRIPIVGKFVDTIFATENKLEKLDRGANFVKQMRNIATQQLKAQGIDNISEPMLFSKVKQLSKIGKFRKQAFEGVDATLGSYMTRNTLQSRLSMAVPFWKWYRALGQVTGHNVMNNPLGTQIMRRLSAEGAGVARQQREMLEGMGYQLYPNQEYGALLGADEEGLPKIFSAGKLVPFKTLSDLAEAGLNFPSAEGANLLNPAIGVINQVAHGENAFGRPATAPDIVKNFIGGDRYYLPENGDPEKLDYNELPAKYRIPHLISTLLRTYTPLGTAERYLPYKSYDSMMFVPDQSKEGKDSIDSILRATGVGQMNTAYPRRKLSRKERKGLLKYRKKVYGR